MYEKLTDNFKKKLTGRRLEISLTVAFCLLFATYFVFTILFWGKYHHWIVILVTTSVFFILFVSITYTIVYFAVKKELNFKARDYFHCIRIIKSINDVLKNDAQILSQLLKEHGINTRPKVQEAIRHYQMLLTCKANKGFATISIVSLVVAVFSIVFPANTHQSFQDMLFLLTMLCLVIFCAIFVCIFFKNAYKTLYYNFSNRSIYERIEAALSEIWMKQLI